MTRTLICTFAAAVFGLTVLTGGFDYAATAKPIATQQSDRGKACAWCWDWCKKNPGQICHCKSRSGCPDAPKTMR
jgi:hypothetical protein